MSLKSLFLKIGDNLEKHIGVFVVSGIVAVSVDIVQGYGVYSVFALCLTLFFFYLMAVSDATHMEVHDTLFVFASVFATLSKGVPLDSFLYGIFAVGALEIFRVYGAWIRWVVISAVRRRRAEYRDVFGEADVLAGYIVGAVLTDAVLIVKAFVFAGIVFLVYGITMSFADEFGKNRSGIVGKLFDKFGEDIPFLPAFAVGLTISLFY